MDMDMFNCKSTMYSGMTMTSEDYMGREREEKEKHILEKQGQSLETRLVV